MTDVFSSAKRSAIMSRIKGENTTPEIIVRKLLHSMGYRFRLHESKLPGKPDIVLPRHAKIIFVHGCFWHGHGRCSRATLPSTNIDFWRKKISGNKLRDVKVRRELRYGGWKVSVIWQCQLKDITRLKGRLLGFLQE
jgi:DNA mismatch endonuclease, patch repair protein